MRLTFKNIGKFHDEVNVDLNGITVVAGVNGTGKSTISKIMYCLLDSMHSISDQVRDNRISIIARKIMMHFRRFLRSSANVYKAAADIVDNFDSQAEFEDILEILNEGDWPLEKLEKSEIKELIEEIMEALQVSEQDIKEEILYGHFADEFGECIKHVNYESEESVIDLQIRDKHINVSFNNNVGLCLNEEIDIIKDIVYLDDLSTIDNLVVPLRRHSISGYGHNDNIRKKIYNKKSIDNGAVDNILARNRYADILSQMNNFNIGELETKGGELKYKVNGLNEYLGIENMSTGTRILASIKRLIINGYIEENGVVVLDEPEIHLHPEWQYGLAEMIVLMQKELGINILINSHSSDFISFIQFFANKYSVSDKCKYYQAKSREGLTSVLEDVSSDVQSIFAELGKRFIDVAEEMSDGNY